MSGPSEPVRGSIELRISAEPNNSVLIDAVRVDDRLVTADQSRTLAIDTRTLSDGPHRVDVIAHDTSRRRNVATASIGFTSHNTPPRLHVVPDPLEGPQAGRTGVIRIRMDEPVRDLQALVGDRSLELQQC